MAIAKRPIRNPSTTGKQNPDRKAEAFIAGAGAAIAEENGSRKKPVLVRVDQEVLARIDQAAKRLGISRAAFMISSSVKEMDRM